MIGDAVVGPAREVELPDLPDLVSAPLRNRVLVLNTQSAANTCATVTAVVKPQ